MFKGIAAAFVAPAMLVGLAGSSASANTQTNEKATTQSQSVQADTDKKANWPIEAPSKGESGNGSATSGTVPASPQKPKSGSGETAQGSVGARDAVPCAGVGDYTWGTMAWTKHADGNDCVVTITGGTASGAMPAVWKAADVTRVEVQIR